MASYGEVRLTLEERQQINAMIRRDGEAIVAEELGVSVATMARACAGWALRKSTAICIRYRLAEQGDAA